MVEEKKTQFLPFHAINEFMRDDYRLTILREVFNNFDKLNKEKTIRINRLFSKGVQIPGFRNSSLAPLGVRIKQSITLYEKSPEFSALVVDCWSDLHKSLKQEIWQLLQTKNWKPLPVDADRTQLPGFMVNWPKGDTFESFFNAVHENNPELSESDDNISLMVVWVGDKLPIGLYDEPGTTE